MLKMAPNSLFAILLRSPWWISLLIAVLIVAGAQALLEGPWTLVFAAPAFPFLVIAAMAAWRQLRQPSPDRQRRMLDELGALPWPRVAALLSAAFEHEGSRCELLKDAAVDFRLSKGSTTTLVQARRWKAAMLGADSLRELLEARERLGAQEVAVVFVGKPSDAAAALIKKHGIRLLGPAELAVLIRPVLGRPERAQAA